MTRSVTLIVLLSYVIFIATFTLISGLGGQAEEKWFELMKGGFTTLGSALTLILGYYFGQKQVAEELKRDKDQTVADLKKKEDEKRTDLLNKLKEQATESQPASFADVDPARLPTRPKPAIT
jgi:type VI protein secretion system component VasK